MNNKKIYLSIGIISVIILTLSITYAWFKWTSNSTNITFNVEDLGITYTGDDINIKSSLYPTIYMDNKDNIIHNFSIKKTTNTDVYLKISLDIIELPSELNEVSFVWNLYKEGTSIAKGDFKNATVGSDLILTPYEMISNNPTSYTLYIWIDGTMDNPISMGNKSFSFKLKLESSQEDYTTKEECFSFNKTTNTITGYLCYEGNEDNLETITDIVIPSSIDGVEVKKIGYGAFRSKGITSVIMPDTVTDIATLAFAWDKISIVVLPKKLETIGSRAFESNNLTSIDFPITLTEIGGGAFTTNNITNVKIPKNVTKIESAIFSNNHQLQNIIISEENTSYSSNNNVIIENATNRLVQGSISSIIPYGVKTIGNSAFKGMKIKNIDIPDSVTVIEEGAFSGCSLTDIILPDGITRIENTVFYNKPISNIKFPKNLKSIGESAFWNSGFITLEIPSTVTQIEASAFKRTRIKNLILNEGIETIKKEAFYASNITSLTIPSTLTTIEESAFSYNKITSIYLKENSKLATLGDKAFSSSSTYYINYSDNTNLTTIYNLSGKSLDWNLAITGASGTAFVSGTVTTDDGRTVTITTSE